MTDFVERRVYTGMRLRVSLDRTVSWQPGKFTGMHGLRFDVACDDLVDMVLAERPKGSWVRITRECEVLVYEGGEPARVGKLAAPPKMTFDKIDPNPKGMKPGMVWTGPFDGEIHHFCDDRFWVVNLDRKRCHWKERCEGLKKSMQRFKPLGGSFIITPWRHVIALVEPQPLPEEAREQWKGLSTEERRLLQIKQKGAGMLPLYVCRLDDDCDPLLDEPVDYSKPMSKEEVDDMLDFLGQFSSTKRGSKKAEEEDIPDDGVEEDWADDDEFFEEDSVDGLMYTPSDE